MLDVNDLMVFEEDEFRRFQMVLYPVLLSGAVGGIRERTFCWVGRGLSVLACSLTGPSGTGAFPVVLQERRRQFENEHSH
jgi:hypothetical protein